MEKRTAILIDPYNREVKEIQIDKISQSLKPLHEYIFPKDRDIPMRNTVERSTWTFDSCNIWLDENGLANNQIPFKIIGNHGWEMFVGPAVITGNDGRPLPKKITADHVRRSVQFVV